MAILLAIGSVLALSFVALIVTMLLKPKWQKQMNSLRKQGINGVKNHQMMQKTFSSHDILSYSDPLESQYMQDYGKMMFHWKTEINAKLTSVSSLIGEKWVMHRKLLDPTKAKQQGMASSLIKCKEDMSLMWEEVLGEIDSCELDVSSEFKKLIADVISYMVFCCSFEEVSIVFQEIISENYTLLLTLYSKEFNSADFPYI